MTKRKRGADYGQRITAVRARADEIVAAVAEMNDSGVPVRSGAIANRFNLNTKAVCYFFALLKEQGIMERHSAGKASNWVVIDRDKEIDHSIKITPKHKGDRSPRPSFAKLMRGRKYEDVRAGEY